MFSHVYHINSIFLCSQFSISCCSCTLQQVALQVDHFQKLVSSHRDKEKERSEKSRPFTPPSGNHCDYCDSLERFLLYPIRNIKTTMLYHKFRIFSESVQRLGGRSSLQKSAGPQRRSGIFDAFPPHLFDIHKVSYEIKTVGYLL